MNKTLRKYFCDTVYPKASLDWNSDFFFFFRDYLHWESVCNEKGEQVGCLYSEVHKNFKIDGWKDIEENKLEKIYQKHWKEGRIQQNRFFAIVFALSYGLSEEQIKIISDKRRSDDKALDILNYFLCNREASNFLKSELTPIGYQNISYFIEIGDKEYSINPKEITEKGKRFSFGFLRFDENGDIIFLDSNEGESNYE